MEEPKEGYLAAFGERIAGNGYAVVPILRGRKFPGFDGWQKSRGDAADVRKWVKEGKGRQGVGLITRTTPALDLDCLNPEAAAHMEAWCVAELGFAPLRVGLAPKRLLLFRSDVPFRKVSSGVWLDAHGRKNQVEIMGDGEQIVAFHIHPDTGRPYTWPSGDSPLTTPAHDLPLLTFEDGRRVAEEMDRYAAEHGFTRPPKAGTSLRPLGPRQDHDEFADVASKVGLSIADLKARLAQIPNSLDGVDYDTWLQVMMGAYHETDGSSEGLEAFNEWSSQSTKHDDRETERKWASLDIEGKGRAPVTARFILKLAKDEAESAAAEALDRLEQGVRTAGTLTALQAAAAAAKRVELTDAARSGLAGLVQQAFKRLKGANLPVAEARKMVRYEAQKSREFPSWLEGYVYVSHDETFFHRKTGFRLSVAAFNAVHGRELMSRLEVLEGKSSPEHLPANVALHLYQVPHVDNVIYLPGEDDLFTLNGRPFANSYTEENLPTVPETPTAADRAAVACVEAHATHLIDNERERSLFLDWLAYIVQSRRRPNWAVLLQGTEGDGKSFWRQLMMRVLGPENVNTVAPQVVEGQFNGWAVGHLLVVMEEIRIAGHNRYEVLNQIKPLITNESIEVHAKHKDPYVAPNTSGYLLLTNHRDALPVASNDTRYFVLSSRWQNKDALQRFMAENPAYYDDLYSALNDHAGAIRGWLLGRKMGSDFNPRGRAPESWAKDYMVELVKSDELAAIEEAIRTSTKGDVTNELLNITDLADALMGLDVVLPPTRVLAKILSDAGFTRLGRVWIADANKTFWSKTPELFQTDRETDPVKVRDWLDLWG